MLSVHLLSPTTDDLLPADEQYRSIVEEDLLLSPLWSFWLERNPHLDMNFFNHFFTTLDQETALYRQAICHDFLQNNTLLEKLFQIALKAHQTKPAYFILLSNNAERLLDTAVADLQSLLPHLEALAQVCQEEPHVNSTGLQTFLTRTAKLLTTSYLQKLATFLKYLTFPQGMRFTMSCNNLLKPIPTDLLYPKLTANKHQFWQLFSHLHASSHSIVLDERDESGFRILSELRCQALFSVAHLLARVRDNIKKFFSTMLDQISFYRCAYQLANYLKEQQLPYAFPVFSNDVNLERTYPLQIALQGQVISTDLSLPNNSLLIITGKNQGGKTTLLRLLGICYLFGACGYFVPARQAKLPFTHLWTHFQRNETIEHQHGKLADELARLEAIISQLHPQDTILLNETFSSTNEAEGSLLAEEIFTALLTQSVRLHCVTHFYQLANYFWEKQNPHYHFLAPQLHASKPFQFSPQEPHPSADSESLFNSIFSG